jgi:hypothetical protein
MNFKNVFAAAAAAAILAPGAAYAQIGWNIRCLDPENDSPYSDDYGINNLENDLAGVTMGVSGSGSYGGGDFDPCYGDNALDLDAAGRVVFYSGPVGSVQTDFDNYLAYTYGAPFDPVGDYGFFRILKTDNTTANSVLFGDGGLTGFFKAASGRTMVGTWADGDVNAELTIRLIGDASRLQWRLTNLTDESLPLGLMFAAYTGMHTTNQTDSETGANMALTFRGGFGSAAKPIDIDNQNDIYLGIVNLPTGRPVRTEKKFTSASPSFPDWVEFAFGQTNYYGMRIENNPRNVFQDAAAADQIIIADRILPGFGSVAGQNFIFGNAARQTVFNDPTGLLEEADIMITEYAFLQRFPVTAVGPGETRTLVHYVTSVWSNGDYRDPYTVVVDAPKLVGTSPTGTNGLSNNPFPIRVYVDNQFAAIDKTVALNNTKVRIELGAGLALAPGQVDSRIIASIPANQIGSATFNIVADGNAFGDIPYRIFIETPVTSPRTLSGIVKIGATPRINRPAGPNMVGLPFTFADNSLNAILGPTDTSPGLQSGIDYQAYRWEPTTQEYVPVVSPQRGQGYWIVLNSAVSRNLNGATVAEDAGVGGLLTALKRGWNLISNPYNYPISLGDLNFVVGGETGSVLRFTEAVSQGVISGGLAYYEVTGGVGGYEFVSDSGEFLLPTRGYWIYSDSFDTLTISWPPVYTPGLPNSGRSAESPAFQQSDRQWRLQLSARSKDGLDASNFVGAVSDPKAAARMDILKPPAAPGSSFQLSIKDTEKGEESRKAHSFVTRSGKMQWDVEVKADKAGEITVTWPNVSALPKNLRLRITDKATGTVRDLRTSSGYTFNASEAGTREFVITAETGGATRALIGGVQVERAGRDVNGPVSISYSLSGDATVSVRILSNTGKEIFSLSRGRSESAGENTVTWLLRDNANRAVAPGVYRAEIVAESPSGERVRRFVPINVVR